jgi:hypothetical protein
MVILSYFTDERFRQDKVFLLTASVRSSGSQNTSRKGK